MIKEFKKFISRGSILDLAVGLIMGTYFGAIVKSLVSDIIMPPVGKALNGVDFTKMKYIIQEAVAADEASGISAVPEIAISYGTFFNAIITFFIVALTVFYVLRAYNRIKEHMEEEEAQEASAPAVPEPSSEERLLIEIRDLLKEQKG